MVTWVLPSGRRYGERAVLADRGEPLGEAVGEHDRQRHQLVGVVAGVAEHHALVAGALRVERVRRSSPCALSWPVSTPWAMSRRLLADGDHARRRSAPSKPFSEES